MSVRLAAVVAALTACSATSPDDVPPPPRERESEPSGDSSATDTAPPAAAPHGGGRGALSRDAGGVPDSGADAGGGGVASTDPFDAARKACVDAVNHYRGLAGVAPLARYPGKEACADAQATTDAAQGSPHYAYLHSAPSCLEDVVLDRQNECPAWYGPPAKAAADCVAKMYAEGPGTGAAHGHYTTMMDPRYERLSCGVRVLPGGPPGADTWLVLDFY